MRAEAQIGHAKEKVVDQQASNALYVESGMITLQFATPDIHLFFVTTVTS